MNKKQSKITKIVYSEEYQGIVIYEDIGLGCEHAHFVMCEGEWVGLRDTYNNLLNDEQKYGYNDFNDLI